VETFSIFHLILLAILCALALLRARVDGRRRWRRFYDFFGGIELGAIFILLSTLVVVGVLQIVLRNFFNTGVLWADPLMRHIVLWLGALGASLATARLRHINIDVFTRLLPKRIKPTRRLLVYTATALAAFVLGVASLRLVVDEKEFGEAAFLGLQTWHLQTVLPFAFFLICYRSLVNLFLGREARVPTGEE
jgi:TRAP-type C4-dicarboxylate transport system permease small subunit